MRGATLVLACLLGTTACDSKDVCTEAADKLKTCLDRLDCAKITDPGRQLACQSVKAIPVTSSPEACRQANPGNPAVCECTGATRESADKWLSCTLDELCMCPDAPTPADGGTTRVFDL